MPSMPMLSTPAFSEICSPSPASSSGTPAVTAPNSSEVRNGWVSSASMALGHQAFAAHMVQIFDQSQEDEQERHQHQYVVLGHTDPPGRTLAPDHQRGEEQSEAYDRIAVEPREENDRHHQQSESRIPVGAHRSPHPQDLNRPGEPDQPA